MSNKTIDELKEENKKYLEMTKLVYRKHHLGHDDIGWDELSDLLCDTLCNNMGDEEFQDWLKSLKEDKEEPKKESINC